MVAVAAEAVAASESSLPFSAEGYLLTFRDASAPLESPEVPVKWLISLLKGCSSCNQGKEEGKCSQKGSAPALPGTNSKGNDRFSLGVMGEIEGIHHDMLQ